MRQPDAPQSQPTPERPPPGPGGAPDAAFAPTLPADPPRAAAGVDAPPGVPGFELLDEVGRGGMGIVYRARDLALDREVAVKVLQEKYGPGTAIAVRFVEEARITAQLQHPGVPAVYQVGALADGRPFLAMKLIKGQTLDALLKQGAPIDALAVFEASCQAVGYAHAHKVIHRDLKPANVMVGAFGEVQVMDWGLAKVLAPGVPDAPPEPGSDPQATTAPTEIHTARNSDGSHTQAGSVLGTPAFMAPEQAAAEAAKINTTADVFGLGAILCVLLTGKPPFDGKDLESARLNAVRGRTQEALARLDACGAEPDVVALCKRCLAFEPADRPATANEVATAAAGLRRAAEERLRLAEQDKLAAQVRAAEQAKRRRAVQWAAGALVVVLLLGAVGTTAGLIWADAARRETEVRRREAEAARENEQGQRLQAEQAQTSEEQQRIRAEEALYFNRIAFASRERAAGNVRQAEALLDLCPPERRRWEWHYLKRLCHGELLTLAEGQDVVNVLAFSPDGEYLASGSGHPHRPGSAALVKLWKTSTWEEVRTLHGHGVAVNNLSFSPQGDRLLSAGYTIDIGKLSRGAERLEEAARGELRLWDVKTGTTRLHIPGCTSGAWTLADAVCAAGHLGKRTVVVWNTRTGGKPLLTLPSVGPPAIASAVGEAVGLASPWQAPWVAERLTSTPGHPGLLTKILYSPDGRRVVTCWMSMAVGALARGEVKAESASQVGVKVWDAQTGELVLSLDGLFAPQLSADGKRLAAVRDEAVLVWDLEQAIKDNGRSPLLTLHGHPQAVNHLGFSPDGRRLATAGMDKIVRVWGVETGQEELTLRGHNDMVTDVRFRPDGRRLLSASWDGSIKVWDATRDPDFRALRGHATSVTDLAFAADSRHLAAVAPDGLRLWDVLERKEVLHLRQGYQSVALSPDGKRLAAAVRPNQARIWDLDHWQAGGPAPAELATLGGHAGRVTALVFSPDSRVLASGSVDPADGARPGRVILSDAGTGALLRELTGLTASVLSLSYRFDGRRLAAGLADGSVLIYDPATGEQMKRLEAAAATKGFAIPLMSVAYSKDGSRLAASTGNALAPDNPGQIVIWDADTGKSLLLLRGHSAVVNSVKFSPDGQRLVSASWDMNRGLVGEVKLWDVATGTDILTLPGHTLVDFSPDGRFLAAVGRDPLASGLIKVWDGGGR
jgi:WD40 repeat protein